MGVSRLGRSVLFERFNGQEFCSYSSKRTRNVGVRQELV